MRTLVIISSILLYLMSCSQSSEENNNEQALPDEAFNIHYFCPICDHGYNVWCQDCGNVDLIWCNNGDQISALSCESCSWMGFPYNMACSGCGKRLRIEPKYWTNRSGKNDPDCQGYSEEY